MTGDRMRRQRADREAVEQNKVSVSSNQCAKPCTINTESNQQHIQKKICKEKEAKRMQLDGN